MKKNIAIIFFFLAAGYIHGQDTLRFMQYNLLGYGQGTSLTVKNQCLRQILPYLHPDILAVNEMTDDPEYHQILLDSTLNVNGVTHYKKTSFSNYGNSTIINMLYYNSEKITYYSQDVVVTDLRDINLYTFYYNAPDLATTHDTAFFTHVIAHLKAGSTQSDQESRTLETQALMNFLSSNGMTGNYLFSGDFNVYTSTEQCFQNLVNYSNPSVRFYDPVNKPGAWHDDATFSPYHSQSTHTNSTGGFASGGMDDRFDFILVTNSILNGLDHLKSIEESYWAVGQDGLRLNQSLIDPPNSSVPADVLSSLYNMSDHLPVILDVEIVPGDFSVAHYDSPIRSFTVQNPATDRLRISVEMKNPGKVRACIVSLLGKSLATKDLGMISGAREFSLPLEGLDKGLYFIRLECSGQAPDCRKFLKL